MHLKVTVGDDGGYRWTMVESRSEQDAVACGVCAYPDPASCQQAALQLLAASPGAMMAVQQSGGGWRWVVDGQDGLRLAESASVFDNAAECGYALHRLRESMARQLRQAV